MLGGIKSGLKLTGEIVHQVYALLIPNDHDFSYKSVLHKSTRLLSNF
jgi:hypothetical protein